MNFNHITKTLKHSEKMKFKVLTQKHQFADVFQKGVQNNFAIFTGKHCVGVSF